VTPEEVSEVLRKYFGPEDYVLAIVDQGQPRRLGRSHSGEVRPREGPRAAGRTLQPRRGKPSARQMGSR
jgi:hypothetical protein